MPKIAYIEKRFNSSSVFIINKANEIIHDYQSQGFSLTLRQLYYQFVARDIIENSQKSYKRLGSIINDARLAGHIDWYSIEDRTRALRGNSHWKDPGQIINSAARSFYMNKWEGQEFYIEVWVEKEALAGVIGSVCRRLDIDYFACKGYPSQTEVWKAARRFRDYTLDEEKTTILLHLGDHDPSGIDMTRDIEDRFSLFGARTEVHRIALNMDQINQYNPPPNPAKTTDARFKDYRATYGNDSWELDALEPSVIEDLITDQVLFYRDEEAYNKVLEQEAEYNAILKSVAVNWRNL